MILNDGPMTALSVISATSVALLIWNKLADIRRRRGVPYPPSPKGVPLIGNALQIPVDSPWIALLKMGKELGEDMFYLDAAGIEGILVLNSFKDAKELLVQRAAQYSNRRRGIMTDELMGWGWLMSSISHNDAFKEKRRLFQKHARTDFIETRALEYTHSLLLHFLEDPKEFRAHIKHATGAFMVSLAYGFSTQPRNDPFITTIEAALQPPAKAMIPGTFLVDFMPWLRYVPEWFPGAGFQTHARESRALMEHCRNKPFQAAEAAIANNTAIESFTGSALEELAEGDWDPETRQRRFEVVKDVAANFFIAGSDTTSSTSIHFILAMICFPEVQQKAQRELDRVIGPNRMPTFEDRDNLPYISAIVEEIYRFASPAPIGVAHRSAKDDVYNGYFIPKDTTVIANSWAMLRNEEDFPEPSRFNPDRYLDEAGNFVHKSPMPSEMAFGFGRRLCPGMHIAAPFLWIEAASMLVAFELSKAKDKDGNTIEPVMNSLPGMICVPQPFQCEIKPRSKAAERLIRGLAVDH